MSKVFQKLLLSILCLSLLTTYFPVKVWADDGTQDRNSAIKFLDSLADYESWKKSWKDYFRPYCQRTEIFKLRTQQSKIREDILNSVLEDSLDALNTSLDGQGANKAINVDVMINEYYKLLAQLYFVRNFQAKTDSSLSKTEGKLAKQNGRKVLEAKISKYLVNDKQYLSSDQLDDYINEFYQRYDKDSYINCLDPSIEGLKMKLQSIEDKFQALSLDNLKEDMELDDPLNYQANPLKDGPNSASVETLLKDIQILKDSPNTKPTIWARLAFRIDNVEPLKDAGTLFSDIYQDMKSRSANNQSQNNNDPSSVSIPAVINAQDKDKQRYAFDVDFAKRLAKYDIKYNQLNDSIIKSFASQLASLDDLIKQAIPELKATSSCLNEVIKKQCSDN
ncbi:MAG: hypothetical protein UR28_C0001G0056 [Candidatus Peregrinibacteria bacterium GW2011_GWF2_33_10]|nr:MAG: hypothetical protein UR28_C0001G0056 [Candidatus Peregrinibacteria bacterium GW2011_GWF2_33_10]OGJ44802.1 MAG: hypothetical protein A2263_06215 [Candidatus Peregrinibacteria bacterium RIFOXYA2_FULL_33_21]OGJ47385.1 MAG: hypothetical protein A2272_02615 [Candidatus Peregrinibacteria bacterium RIFOXYA12_FULL_33_12]OGJ50488.1 MAG: hypothetical protein A2307_02840 [Candidatus Peregrinibacteria bacterium RIFOXYB2_FULL_33_20]